LKKTASGVSQYGATLIEFALVLPLFLLLVIGILTYGIAFATQQIVQHAAQRSAEVVTRVDPLADDYNDVARRLVNEELAYWLDFLPVSKPEVEEVSGFCSGNVPADSARLCIGKESGRRVIRVDLAPAFEFPLTGYISELEAIRGTGRNVVATDDGSASS
tara:strand:- start:537 stop:1019 length:483 start_codon:yes stop_codon:yes gene_type:complete